MIHKQDRLNKKDKVTSVGRFQGWLNELKEKLLKIKILFQTTGKVTQCLLYSFIEAATHRYSAEKQKQWPKGVLKNFTKFSGKHLCRNFFFDKVAGFMLPFLQSTS